MSYQPEPMLTIPHPSLKIAKKVYEVLLQGPQRLHSICKLAATSRRKTPLAMDSVITAISNLSNAGVVFAVDGNGFRITEAVEDDEIERALNFNRADAEAFLPRHTNGRWFRDRVVSEHRLQNLLVSLKQRHAFRRRDEFDFISIIRAEIE